MELVNFYFFISQIICFVLYTFTIFINFKFLFIWEIGCAFE